MREKIPINNFDAKNLEEIEYWINHLYDWVLSDIKQINELYSRIAWLSQPWWKRVFRHPPWL